MLEQQTNELDAIVARWQQLLDLHGRDLARWPPEAEAEIYALNERAPLVLSDALQQLRRACPDC